MIHETVLLHEAVEALAIRPDSTIVDTTFGAGGHARAILAELGTNGSYIGIDTDQTALRHSLNELENVTLVHGNFRDLHTIMGSIEVEKVDGILADLGWRMEQFSGNGRGFSFRHDEPLLMTLGDPASYDFTARDIVNQWDEHVLADIIYGYGEERFARRIASKIVATRDEQPIETSKQLSDLIVSAYPAVARHGRTHVATKTFQALRIAVNEELTAIEELIEQGIEQLAPQGRLVIITFHSIEDRVVKHAFKAAQAAQRGIVVTKKPTTASSEELETNPRARSAKLRIFEKQ
jgi:16S rRNA (cytosine1402-N4)-methyltransferase